MIRSMASRASALVRATTTPFPAASPSAFTTSGYRVSLESSRARASAAPTWTENAAVGMR